jgi:hypothetical protein
MYEPFPDLESTEGLGVREKSRLEYHHTRQLTITLYEQREERVERYPFVFLPVAVIANEDLDRC